MTIYAVANMEAELKVWDAEIKLLEAKIESANAGVKLQRVATMMELRAKQRVATEKLNEMKKSSNEAWQDVKKTADKIWDELKGGIARAHANFK